MSAWEATADPRIQVQYRGKGLGWIARFLKPVPTTRVRCDVCGKDGVPKKDGTLHKHKCEGENQYHLVDRPFTHGGFNAREVAIDVAAKKAGIHSMRLQVDWIKEQV